MSKVCSRHVVIALATAGVCLPQLVTAQTQPARSVRVLVGAVAGGTTDLMARIVTRELSSTEQSYVVDNRPGASGMIATDVVAKSAPDGATLTMVGSAHSRVPALYPNVPYDTIKDLSCIGLVAKTPYVLVVHPSIPSKTSGELVSALKKHPGTVYATPGAGTGQHLSAELFKRMTGVALTEVHYKGSGALRPDLLSGRVPIAFDNISLMLPYLTKGSLRALAITDTQRSNLLPDVPTLAESGLRSFEVLGWFALLAPAKTPAQQIQKMNAALNDAVTRPAVTANLLSQGALPMSGTPKRCDDFVAGEVDKWAKVIRENKIRLE